MQGRRHINEAASRHRERSLQEEPRFDAGKTAGDDARGHGLVRGAPVTSIEVMAALNCASCRGLRFRYSQRSRPSLCSSKGTASCFEVRAAGHR